MTDIQGKYIMHSMPEWVGKCFDGAKSFCGTVHIYIYIYRERERERDGEKGKYSKKIVN